MTLLSDIAARVPAAVKARGGALVLVATLQLGVLGWMVVDRVRLLKTGREIVLPIVPVDPRDIFKGDYVQLGYPVSTVSSAALADVEAKPDARVYVTLEQATDGTWSAVKASPRYQSPATSNHVVLRGRFDSSARQGNGTNRVRYGIERYYVPEGHGLGLEKLAREKKLAAIVAVDSRGNAAIKGLSADGKTIYDEPLF